MIKWHSWIDLPPIGKTIIAQDNEEVWFGGVNWYSKRSQQAHLVTNWHYKDEKPSFAPAPKPHLWPGGEIVEISMKKYRKKPIVIEAVQFDPQGEWPACVVPWPKDGPHPRDMSWGYIETLEGKMHVIAGDWIIKGVENEMYPCKDSIFRQSYEPVEGDWPAGEAVK